jgi:hypothetical protein
LNPVGLKTIKGNTMAKKIMIVRHGEKPDKSDRIHGVDAAGEHDKNELSPKGWQRSGALIRFFNPLNGQFQNPALAKPTAILAAAPSGHAQSLRSRNTVQALADSMHVHINLKHSKGEEKKLVDDLLATPGVVLIAWEHKAIIDVANQILGNDQSSPQRWPDSRFDLVWVFDQQPHPPGWKFAQVPQMLLPTDRDDVL